MRSKNRSFIFSGVALLLLCLCLAHIQGCGGGTSGTDLGGQTRIFGILQETDQSPIEGALVAIAESGETTVTEAGGAFVFITTLEAPQLTFIVTDENTSLSSESIAISEEIAEISVTLEFDRINSQVDTTNLETRSRPTPSPTPRGRTPRATKTPAPAPTSGFTKPPPGPTRTPTPGITKFPRTPTPTSTPRPPATLIGALG